jgi:cell division protein FtsL
LAARRERIQKYIETFKMKLKKYILVIFCSLTLIQVTFAQKTLAFKIDSVCRAIDTLSINFKKVKLKGLGRQELKSITLYYIDTLNKAYRKVLYQKMSDKVINTYYFKNQEFIKLEVSKKVRDTIKILSTYYFQKGKVVFKSDQEQLIKQLKTYIDNSKEYLEDPVIIQ